MGSGHILAYAFDVLMEIYKEYGYSEREAAAEIVQHNLHGLDIDERCTQLADFVVMMKARQYDRRFFSRGISAQVYCPKEDQELVDFGALVQVKELGDEPTEPEELTLFNMNYADQQNDWNYRRVLSQKYAVVCTNPPYLNKYNDRLKKFVTENYKDFSGDLFSVFIYRNFGFCKKEGYSAFMTPFVWMFIKTYEKLRNFIISNKAITSLIQMEYSAFEEATVPICSFVLQNKAESEKGLYFKLSEFTGGMEVQRQKVLEAIQSPDCGYFYETSSTTYRDIEGSPIAFWASPRIREAFKTCKKIAEIAPPKQGLATANNERFLKIWSEVNLYKIGFGCESCKDALNSGKKWFPYNKGGAFRRWYGNREYVVNWENDGFEIKNFRDENGKVRSRPQNTSYYFKPAITWSDITSASFSGRYSECGFMFDVKGSSGFPPLNQLSYVLGSLNSFVSQKCIKILNPTITTQVGDMSRIPLIVAPEYQVKVTSYVNENISLSKKDWDSFETSWDFQIHPLIRLKDSMKFAVTNGDSKTESYFLQGAYRAWENECEERFNQLKANEEELNRIFIDIYGLQDELTPEVEDKDVTVRKADLQRDIKSLISYAVGCMFGRYSPLKDGLLYAGGDWDYAAIQQELMDAIGKNEFSSGDMVWDANFIDKDNILPICDDEYFEDDIVGRFINFISDVYGKDTLEENLKFIADALGGKSQPKEVIRNYFLNDFFADHCKIYQKRPIYWLFDSGKKNGFKALIYMHRYQPDTIARIRTDYVHEQQARYRTAIQEVQRQLAGATTADKVRLNKKLNKLTEQDTELRTYEEKVHHLADQMIPIDLDDGVKVNYAKFQDVLAKIK